MNPSQDKNQKLISMIKELLLDKKSQIFVYLLI